MGNGFVKGDQIQQNAGKSASTFKINLVEDVLVKKFASAID